VDDAGDPAGDAAATERAKTAKAWRDVVLSLVAAGVFGALFTAYILKSVKLPEGPVLVATSDAAPRGPDTLEIAQRVAGAFVEALRSGDAADAYALMARPYRESATLAAFQHAWRTPLLASPRAVKLSRASERATQLDGKFLRTATFTATGVLVAAVGALDVSFTFLREADDAHVLAVFVGGVPIVQGMGPSTTR
jgi:hypothetical protein